MPIEMKLPKAFSIGLGILVCGAGRNGVGALAVLWCQELRLCLGWGGKGNRRCWLSSLNVSWEWFCLQVAICAPLEGQAVQFIPHSIGELTWGDKVSCPMEQCRAELTLECLPPSGKQGSHWPHLLIIGRRVKSILHLAVFKSQINKQYFYFYKMCPEERGNSSAV